MALEMNVFLTKKLLALTNTNNINDLILKDYKDIGFSTENKDINLTRVRGSIRLLTSRILLPIDISKEKEEIEKYSFR
jgi:uncharacterized pyridoxamine 5'-phosphate oxidase family protein